MTAWMPPPLDSRKRPAPGASPNLNVAMQNQQFPGQQPVANGEFMRWDTNPVDNTMYPDLNFNMAGYNANNVSNPPQYHTGLPAAPSTQLARRPNNRHLMQTEQRAQFDSSNDWHLTEEGAYDPNNQLGALAENDSIERLEERAQLAKRDAQSKRKQIPPFVQKLSSFLDDGKNTELIRWSDRGDSFVVLDEDEFAKTLIPELFKHNNYASFVRQLNMYGFHKRVGLSDNSMKASERKNKSPSEYYNPYFKRGHPNLLWLINKPKNPQKKGKGGRAKQEEGQDESDDENRDGVEETFGGYGQDHIPKAISAVPDGGQAGPMALTVVQKQLRDIQQQQNNISNMISRLRKEHNDLYSQAVAFQTLHDRHESSINAILTFLATVYNRSLDGQGGGNIAQMFSNAIPQDQHQQGNVVDLGNMNQGQPMGNLSPMRRQQRLIMAPPGNRSSVSNVSTPSAQGANSGSSTYGHLSADSPRSGAIEELNENSPGKSPQVAIKPDPDASTTSDPTSSKAGPLPQQDIMEIINNTNARVPRQKDMAFPDVLQHYEHANGNSPLTSQQRTDMLHLIASSSGSSPGINALVSPSPNLTPSLEQMGYTQAEIDNLMRLQQEQDNKISQVSNLLGPLTPTGHIPGVDPSSGNYFNNGDVSPLGGSNLDLDQYLDTGAYYTADGDGTGGYGSYDAFNNDTMGGGLNFGLDGQAPNGTAAAASPSPTATDPLSNVGLADDNTQGGREDTPKRRRIE